MGSCFSENIGNWMEQLLFKSVSNPLGISYNPISIAMHLSRSLNENSLNERDLIKAGGKTVALGFHSSFNRYDAQEYLDDVNKALRVTGQSLLIADFLFITFGTAIAFRNTASGEIVNNCHRLPAANFTKEILDIDNMLDAMAGAIQELLEVNRKLKLVLTVSPIRHLRHGAVANMRSKSRLILLCEQIEKRFEACTYLPVFELVMDELRDYRYYRQEDLIHLNELGINIIQDRFTESLIDPKSYPLMKRVKKWRLMKNHKISDAGTTAALAFATKLEEETKELSQLLPSRKLS